MKPLTFHPVAEMFPLMEGAEFDDLCEDIRKHGQRHSCLKTGTEIIDGRNRYRATQKLGIKCRFDEWDGKGSLTEISCSLNFHRRHLTPSQRAATGAIAEESFAEEAKERQRVAGQGKAKLPDAEKGQARDQAAKACRVSARYIQDAKAVRQHDPALFAKLVDGSVTITVAARAVHRARKRAANKAATPTTAVSDGSWQIIVGDCLVEMPKLARRKARLVCWDPPYNIGVDYGGGGKRDLLDTADYFSFAKSCCSEAAELLTPDGSLWVIINHEWASVYETILRKIGLHPRGWLTWYETFGNNCTNNFNRTSRRLLYFTASGTNCVFDRRAANRPSMRQLVYGDKRAVSAGKIHDDVWVIPRLVDNAPERLPDFPTQIPVEVMRRIVGICTEPGDLVIDPTCGSGTTGAACIELGRQFIGIEQSKRFAKDATARLQRKFAEATARSGK